MPYVPLAEFNADVGSVPEISNIPPTQDVPEIEDIPALLSRIEKEEGIPTGRLSALAATESNFDPEARNKTTSATGMFQFIDATGADEGLVGEGFDDRTNPEKAARAAARMLKRNTEALGGDWDMGIQAHHTGLGGVKKYGGADPNNPESVDYLRRYGEFYTPSTETEISKPMTADDFFSAPEGEMDASDFFGTEKEPVVEEAPKADGDVGYTRNIARGMGERLGELGSNLMAMGDRAAGWLEEKLPLGTITIGKDGIKHVSKEEAVAAEQAGDLTIVKPLESAANYWEDTDLGYQARTDWEDVKEASGITDTIKEGMAFAMEQGLVSLPDMAAIITTLPAYVASRTQEMAEARSESQGREQPNEEDYALGAATAIAVTAFDRFALGSWVPSPVLSKSASTLLAKPGVGTITGATKGATTEATTEAIQEGMEYAVEFLGTEKGASLADAVDRMGAGAVGGGGFGGVMGAGAGTIESIVQGGQETEGDKAKAPPPAQDLSQGEINRQPDLEPIEDYDQLDQVVIAVEEAVANGDEATTRQLAAQIEQSYGPQVAVEVVRSAINKATPAEDVAVDDTSIDTSQGNEAIAAAEAAAAEVDGKYAPEPDSTLAAQMDAFNDGSKRAILITEGEDVPDLPPTAASTEIEGEGTLIYNAEDTEAVALAQAGEMGTALGYGVATKPENPSAAVVAKDAQGRVVHEIIVDEASTQAVVDAQMAIVGEDGTVDIVPVEQMMGDRIAAKETESSSSGEPVVPLTSDPASQDNTPLAQDLATGLNALLNEDKKIRSVVGQKGRSNKVVRDQLGLGQSPLMERIDLVDNMLSTIANQIDMLIEQGYNIKPLKDIFVRDTPKGTRRIGLKKAREGGILRSIELKEQGKGGGKNTGTKQSGKVTNATLDKIVDAINANVTEVMKAGPAIKTGTIPGGSEKVTRGTKAKAVSKQRSAPKTPSQKAPKDTMNLVDKEETYENAPTTEQGVEEATESAGQAGAAPKGTAAKAKSKSKSEPKAKDNFAKVEKYRADKEKKRKAKEKEQSQKERSKAKAAKEERLANKKKGKTLNEEEIKRVETEKAKEAKAVAEQKQKALDATERQHEQQTKSADLKRKAAEKKRRDQREQTYEESPAVEQGVEEAQEYMAGTTFIGPTGQQVTATGRVKRRGGHDWIQVFRPWTEAEIAEYGDAYNGSKGTTEYIAEYELNPPAPVTTKAKGTVTGIRVIHPNAATAHALQGRQANILNEKVDAVVSPANSNGDMNGGIDRLYQRRWPDIEAKVKQEIVNRYGEGQMPIGDAFVIKTGDPDIPNLIVSPTMSQAGGQTDVQISGLATMAALKAADDAGLKSVTLPGMGTGIGGLNPQKAGEQMVLAQDYFEAYQDGDLTWEQALRGYRTGMDVNQFIKVAGTTDAKPHLTESRSQHTKKAAKEVEPTRQETFTGDMNEVIKQARAWEKMVLAEAKEAGRKLVILYHGTAKRFAQAVSDSPRTSPSNNAHRIVSGRGVYAAPNPEDAVGFAGLRHGGEDVGLASWAWYADEFEAMQRTHQVSVGEMTYISDPNNATDNKTGRITEYFFDPKIIQRQYDAAVHKQIEQKQYDKIPDNAKGDVKAGRDRAATMLDQQFNDQHQTDGAAVVSALLQTLDSRDPLVPILEKIRDANIGLDGINVFSVNDEMMEYATGHREAGGAYAPGKSLEAHNKGEIVRRILLNENLADTRQSVSVLVHELVHAAVSEGLRTDNKAGRDMNKLFKLARGHVDEVQQGLYGFTNVDEFVAEALSNSSFQELLASIPVGEGKSAWTKFVETVRNLLGLGLTSDPNVLSSVLALAPELMMTEAEIELSIAETMAGEAQYISKAEEVAETAEMYGQDEYVGEDGLIQFRMSKGERAKRVADRKADAELVRVAKQRGGAELGAVTDTMVRMFNAPSKKQNKQYVDALKEKGGSAGLGLMTADYLESAYEDDFDGLYRDESGGTPTPGNPIKDYFRARQREQTEGKKLLHEADAIDAAWRSWEGKSGTDPKSLDEVILESTMFEVDASVPWTHARNKITRSSKKYSKTAEKAHRRLRQKLIDSGGLAMYRKARDFYESTFKTMRTHIIDNVLDMHGLKGVPGLAQKIIAAKSEQDLNAIVPPYVVRTVNGSRIVVEHPRWKELVGNFKNLNNIMNANGPYFPQMRFGEYAFEYKRVEVNGGYASKKSAEDAARQARSDSAGSKTGNYRKEADGTWSFDLTETGFQTNESRLDAQKEASRLESEGFDVGSVHKKTEMQFGKDSAAGQILAVANSKLKGPGAERSKKALREALITMLPETSMQKRLLKRQNIHGADINARRVFANYAQSAGKHIARLKYRTQVDKSFNAVMGAAKESARKKRGDDVSIRVGNVANEIQKRHNMDTESGKMAQLAAKAGFLGYLFSLSYSAVNATQPLLMTIPYLSGKHGGTKATAALAKAYKTVWGDIYGSLKRNKVGLVKLAGKPIDMNTLTDDVIQTVERTDPGAAKVLRELMDRGILDATFSLEISEAAKSKDNVVGKGLDGLIEIGRTLPYTVEIMNRITTALAAYDLAAADGTPADQIADVVHKAVVKTQFDYTMANRPRIFKANDLAKIMTMFKIHPLGVYSLVIGNVRRLTGDSKVERKEAARTLKMFFLMHGAFAGAAGSLLMEPIKAAIGLVDLMFGDDDDEDSFLDNPELAIRNLVYDITGSKKVAEVVTHGLPRLVGVDMANRVGLNNMMVMVQQGDNAWDTTMRSLEKSIVGPVFGATDGLSRAVAHHQQGGGIGKTLEYAAPKGLRDLSRALRYATEGMTDFKGNPIISPEEFSPLELAIKAFGFGTTTEAETYEKRAVAKNLTIKMENKRRKLMNQFNRAFDTNREDDVRAQIDAYNDGLADDLWVAYNISGSDLASSRKARVRGQIETEGGVRLKKDQRPIRDRLEAFK